MGTVVSFPERVSTARGAEAPQRVAGSATVIILPTIRIERHVEESAAGRKTSVRVSPGRKPRRRASRS
jgi:hypothetical protein